MRTTYPVIGFVLTAGWGCQLRRMHGHGRPRKICGSADDLRLLVGLGKCTDPYPADRRCRWRCRADSTNLSKAKNMHRASRT